MNDYPQDPRTPPKVRVPITKYEEVYLDCHQEKEVAISYFCKRFKLNPDYHIKDGYVVYIYEEATSHRYDVTDKIREATDEDIILYGMLDRMRLRSDFKSLL